ncbi:hypothetical protein RAD16_02640 [Bradyrhizobium sp. 18BD]
MNDFARSAIAAIIVVIAAVWAVSLLTQNPPAYAAAVALLVGAGLTTYVLRNSPAALGAPGFAVRNYSRFAALAIALGAGVVVAIALIWILYKVTSGWTTDTIRTIVGLPLIVILGVTVLLIVIGLVAFSFQAINLGNRKEALGLPSGSVRAIIALMLLVVFSIMSIFLFNSLSAPPLRTLEHVTQSGLNDMGARVTVIRKQAEPPPAAAAGAAAAEPLYTVTFQEANGPAGDLAKQLIVMLGTLVTAVASFYFGASNVVSAQKALAVARNEPENAKPDEHKRATESDEEAPADTQASAAPPNLLNLTAFHADALAIPETINRAFLGHGMFLEYGPLRTLNRYANYGGGTATTLDEKAARFVKAMQDMHIGSVWIQLFTASGTLDNGSGGTRELVAALKQANIACAGWGYCYSQNAATDGDLAKQLCNKYGIDAFIADVEPGNPVHGQPDHWQTQPFKNLMASLKATFGKDNLGMSTFGNLNGHPDAAAIYRLAVNDVAFYAPQIYWYKKTPVAYAKLCVDSFRQSGIGNPIIATVQSYWDADSNFPQGSAEAQVKQFIGGFPDWGSIIGLNWYHAGNQNTASTGAMSDNMITEIANARLDQKPYAAPVPADSTALAV